MSIALGGRQLGLGLAAGVAVLLKSPAAYIAAFVGGVGRDVGDLIAHVGKSEPTIGVMVGIVVFLIAGVLGIRAANKARNVSIWRPICSIRLLKQLKFPAAKIKAFRVFVNEMGTWWPLHKRSVSMISGKPAKSLRIEPKQGGKIVEIGHDDTEHLWGTIRSFDPPDSISMHFHIGLPAENASLVEVRFTALENERTRVELTQSNWEAFGEMAEKMRGGYGSGWVIIFEQPFKSACGG